MGRVLVTLLMTTGSDEGINPVESSVSSTKVPVPETISHLTKFSPTWRLFRDVMESVSPMDTLYEFGSPSIVTSALAVATNIIEQSNEKKKISTQPPLQAIRKMKKVRSKYILILYKTDNFF